MESIKEGFQICLCLKIIICIFVLFLLFGENKCQNFQIGKYLKTEFSLATFKQYGPITCAKLCMYLQDCKSFDVQKFECSINNVDESTTNISSFLTSPSATYGERSQAAAVVNSSCRINTCPINHKCVPLRSNRTACIRIECVDAPPTFGQATSDWLGGRMEAGSVVNYTCDVGYEMVVGNGQAVCNIKGQWKTGNLVCQSIGCGTPPTVTNAVTGGGGSTYTSTRTYTCDTGYENSNVGTTQAVCESDGSWSIPTMTCTAVDCGTPPTVTNAAAGAGGTTYTSTRTYTCDTGYENSNGGTTQALCGSDGSWSVPTMSCTAVECGTPPTVTNAAVGAGGTTYRSTRTYTCDTGYENSNIGTTQAVCGSDESWSVPTMSCTIIDCGSLPTIANAVAGSGGTTYSSSRTYTCDTGYENSNGGTTQSICGSDGSWSVPTMSCTAVDCGTPPTVTNAAAGAGGTTYSSTRTYTCNTGNENSNGGTTQAVCGSDGSWSVPTMTCTVVDCGTPPTVTNAAVGAGATTYSSSRTYTCDTGHENSNGGTTQAVCGSDGSWSVPTMTCTATGGNTCPSGYQFVQSINFCFKYYGSYKTFADANAECNTDGGALVSVDTEDKWTTLRDYLQNGYQHKACFTSAERASSGWEWGNGNVCDLSHANPQVSIKAYHNCLYQQVQYWYSTDCGGTKNFICEVVL